MVLPWGFCPGGSALGVLPWGFCPGGFCMVQKFVDNNALKSTNIAVLEFGKRRERNGTFSIFYC
ncbi:hypothetical protein BHOIPH801_08400 [Bartonella henselae]